MANSLDLSSRLIDTDRMGNGRRRPRRKRPNFVGPPAELGTLLADLRMAKGLSLREVEEATDRAVSNAYLSQLENGRIKKPSPNVLHALAEVYSVPYEALMEKAGLSVPISRTSPCSTCTSPTGAATTLGCRSSWISTPPCSRSAIGSIPGAER